jgi:hypothetical protein
MKKFRLDPEALVVEEFPTTDAVRALRGTVRANEDDSEACFPYSQGTECFDINSISGPAGCLCPRDVASANSPC